MQSMYYGDRPEFPVPQPHEQYVSAPQPLSPVDVLDAHHVFSIALSTRPPTMPEVSVVGGSEL